MSTVTISRGGAALGKTFTYAVESTVDGAVLRDPSMAAAKTGALTTRTSDTAGTLTMTAGHGFTNGQVIDIYWSGGQCTNAIIGTVATNSVPFTGAGGDVLPADESTITAMVVQTENFVVVDGDLQALMVGAGNAACSATFFSSGDAVVGRVLVRAGTTANKHYIWDIDNDADVPLSADAAYVQISHGDSASSRTVNVLAMAD